METSRKHLTRLTVAGSTIALFAGIVVPAYACTPPESQAVTLAEHPAAVTADGLKARVDSFVTTRLAELSAKASKVTGSTQLTGAQKAAELARIQAEAAALTALKAKVDAETTVSAIRADIAAARLANLRMHVDNRIDERLTRLADALARIQASTKMSAAQKATAAARVQAKVAALTALKAKVDAETTAKAVLVDLRAAGALWDRWGDGDRHRKGDDPRKRSGRTVDAAWRGGNHATGSRVALAGRDHAVSRAGHHGFDDHSGSHPSGGHGGSGR